MSATTNSYFTDKFSSQLKMRKEQAKVRLGTEINFLVDDLFSLFTSEFACKLERLAQLEAQLNTPGTSTGRPTKKFTKPNETKPTSRQSTSMLSTRNRTESSASVPSFTIKLSPIENSNNYVSKKIKTEYQNGSASYNSPKLSENIQALQQDNKYLMSVHELDPGSDCDCDDCLVTYDTLPEEEAGSDGEEVHDDTSIKGKKRPHYDPNFHQVPAELQLEEEEVFGTDDSPESAFSGHAVTIHLDCPEVNCGLIFPNYTELNNHLASIHRINLHRCISSSCSQSFPLANQLILHIASQHSDLYRTWRCAECSRDFLNYHGLFNHNRRNHQTGLFRCHQANCETTANTLGKIRYHQDNDHAKNRFTCHFCQKSFTRPNHLRIHYTVHTGARPFLCTWEGCGNRCRNKQSMVAHIRQAHFRLPKLLRDQKRLGIVDTRLAEDYFIIQEKEEGIE